MLEVIHGTSGRPSTGPSGSSTGEVQRDEVRRADQSNGPKIGNVFFAPSARTYWHAHNAGQLLIGVAGVGLVADVDGAVRMTDGDVVWTPAGISHWHGATADQFHVQLSISTGQTVWLTEVAEEDYRTANKERTAF